jgi:hypothetical protein
VPGGTFRRAAGSCGGTAADIDAYLFSLAESTLKVHSDCVRRRTTSLWGEFCDAVRRRTASYDVVRRRSC